MHLGKPLPLALALVMSVPAWATEGVAHGLEQARQSFRFARYDEALRLVEELIDSGAPSADELRELHQVAGVAAFTLKKERLAMRHLGSLLRLDPEARLDPYLYAPPLVAFMEDLRAKMAQELALIRVQRELASVKAAAKEKPPEPIVLTPVSQPLPSSKPQLAFHFLPFGVAQFSQGRRGMGWALALGQGLTAAGSLATLITYFGMLSRREVEVEGTRTTEWVLSPRLRDFAGTIRTVNLVSSILFYVFYAFGVGDGLWHRAEAPTLTPSTQGPSLSWSFQ